VLISIPRDSYVDIPGYGWNKINAALAYGGASLLIQTVENVTGLKIDHYMGDRFRRTGCRREQDRRRDDLPQDRAQRPLRAGRTGRERPADPPAAAGA
jgi:LytR_cpsA_psr family